MNPTEDNTPESHWRHQKDRRENHSPLAVAMPGKPVQAESTVIKHRIEVSYE